MQKVATSNYFISKETLVSKTAPGDKGERLELPAETSAHKTAFSLCLHSLVLVRVLAHRWDSWQREEAEHSQELLAVTPH